MNYHYELTYLIWFRDKMHIRASLAVRAKNLDNALFMGLKSIDNDIYPFGTKTWINLKLVTHIEFIEHRILK